MISIIGKSEIENGWQFDVRVNDSDGSSEYAVILDKNYWMALTGGEIEPEKMAIKTFEFLLEREPRESILPEFNIEEVKNYFPEYEEAMTEEAVEKL